MNPAYGFIAGSVILTVYGQLIVKWQVGKLGEFPSETGDRLRYVLDFFANPWTISAFLLAGVAAICWIAALSKIELSRAYPFISASFILVLISSAIFFAEPITATKVVGAVLIVTGLIIGSQV